MKAETIQLAIEALSPLLTARRRPSSRWVLLLPAGFFAACGGVFLVIALYRGLAELMAPGLAAAVAGAVLLAAAAAFYVAAFHRPIAGSEAEALPVETIMALGAEFLEEIETTVEQTPRSSMVAAFAIGCLLSRIPGLERLLRDVIQPR